VGGAPCATSVGGPSAFHTLAHAARANRRADLIGPELGSDEQHKTYIKVCLTDFKKKNTEMEIAKHAFQPNWFRAVGIGQPIYADSDDVNNRFRADVNNF
jgi:hypothetical protein